MASSTREAIEARHVPESDEPGICRWDETTWGENGCDTAQVLALLDEARGHEKANAVLAGKWHHDSIQTHIELAEAEAREARLREALDRCLSRLEAVRVASLEATDAD